MMRLLFILIPGLVPVVVQAEPGLAAVTVSDSGDGGQTYSLSLQLLLLMTVLTLLPAALMAMTAFTRIIIVLAILRQALGTAQTPTTQTLIGLALFLTLFVMAPVFNQVYQEAVQPYVNEEIGVQEALSRAAVPFRQFMLLPFKIMLFVLVDGWALILGTLASSFYA